MVKHARPQEILKRLDGSLGLPIGLRVISRAHNQPATHRILQRLPESGGESWVSIGDYTRRHTMQPHDLTDIQLCQLRHRHPQIYRQEVGTLGETVYYNPYSIVVPHGLR